MLHSSEHQSQPVHLTDAGALGLRQGSFWRRLIISVGVVVISAIPMLIVNIPLGLFSPWMGLGVLLEDGLHLPVADSVMFALSLGVTPLVLIIAARRPWSSVIATSWFAANSLIMWIVWESLDGFGQGI